MLSFGEDISHGFDFDNQALQTLMGLEDCMAAEGHRRLWGTKVGSAFPIHLQSEHRSECLMALFYESEADGTTSPVDEADRICKARWDAELPPSEPLSEGAEAIRREMET